MPAEHRDLDLLPVVVLGGLGVLFAGSGLVYATAAVAGLLFQGRLPDLAPSDASSVVVNLPRHLAEPRDAFPLGAREAVPGPVGFYLALALVLGLLLMLALGGLRLVAQLQVAGRAARMRSPWPRRSGVYGMSADSQAFATKHDIADLVVKAPEPGRVVLGRAHGRLIATEREHSVLVVGATRSGKTTGYAIPALLDWAGPAVVLSAKTDLLHATLSARADRGDTLIYDPTKVSGLPGHGWSPLARSTEWRGAVRAANAMSKVSGTTAGLGGTSNHWERVAAQLLAPLLLAAATGGLDMGDVVRWVMTKELEEPKALLLLLGDGGEVALTSLQSYLDLEPRAQDSSSTARTVLDAYEDPDVVDACRAWDITPERLLDGGHHTIYLVANSSDQTRLAPVFLALLDELLRSAFLLAAERRARTGNPLGRPDGKTAPRLMLLLDEAANIAPIPDLATLASTAGGEGVQLVTIYQDLSQLRHRYGSQWGSIASNHVAKVVLPGVTDPELSRTSLRPWGTRRCSAALPRRPRTGGGRSRRACSGDPC
ncbi:MAG: type IV secretory system conjugative DNA transfer family protein [Actinomycetota bacterium]|nr:type IV secretory system conjugative DNA transfer family protein [Actinomycetota bacterium]